MHNSLVESMAVYTSQSKCNGKSFSRDYLVLHGYLEASKKAEKYSVEKDLNLRFSFLVNFCRMSFYSYTFG